MTSREQVPAHRMFDAEVTAFHRESGQQQPVWVSCTQYGPGPAGKLQPPPAGTCYELKLVGGQLGPMVLEASTPWDGLTEVRERLEQQGWFLAVAAALPDHYPVQLPRRFAATTVAELRHPAGGWRGFLKPVDPSAVGTVADQQARYQQWLDYYDRS